MTVADLASTKFAFSPLAETGLSLYLLSGGEVKGLHQGWFLDVPAMTTGRSLSSRTGPPSAPSWKTMSRTVPGS